MIVNIYFRLRFGVANSNNMLKKLCCAKDIFIHKCALTKFAKPNVR